eukprot:1250214-Amphidinium_carterae.2
MPAFPTGSHEYCVSKPSLKTKDLTSDVVNISVHHKTKECLGVRMVLLPLKQNSLLNKATMALITVNGHAC